MEHEIQLGGMGNLASQSRPKALSDSLGVLNVDMSYAFSHLLFLRKDERRRGSVLYCMRRDSQSDLLLFMWNEESRWVRTMFGVRIIAAQLGGFQMDSDRHRPKSNIRDERTTAG